MSKIRRVSKGDAAPRNNGHCDHGIIYVRPGASVPPERTRRWAHVFRWKDGNLHQSKCYHIDLSRISRGKGGKLYGIRDIAVLVCPPPHKASAGYERK